MDITGAEDECAIGNVCRVSTSPVEIVADVDPSVPCMDRVPVPSDSDWCTVTDDAVPG